MSRKEIVLYTIWCSFMVLMPSLVGVLIGQRMNEQYIESVKEEMILEEEQPFQRQVVVNFFFILPDAVGEADLFEKTLPIEPQSINREFNVFTPCGYSEEELIHTLSDEYRYTLIPYVDTFLKAEEEYGVNAFYLICKCGLESGWGKYVAAENNIAGWSNSDGTYMSFDSVEDCIMHVSQNLSDRYRTYTDGSIGDICKLYCPNDDYTNILLGIMEDQDQKIRTMRNGRVL